MHIVEIETEQGKIPHTLNFRWLNTFQHERADQVRSVNKMLMKGTDDMDIAEMMSVTHLAYLCACRALSIEPMDDDEYYELAGDDYIAVGSVLGELAGKRKAPGQNLS